MVQVPSAFFALFGNFEELGIGRVEIGTSGVTARGHVGHDGPGVVHPGATFTVCPGESDYRAGVCVCDECGLLSVVATVHVGV
jgi:hypothetical protein